MNFPLDFNLISIITVRETSYLLPLILIMSCSSKCTKIELNLRISACLTNRFYVTYLIVTGEFNLETTFPVNSLKTVKGYQGF